MTTQDEHNMFGDPTELESAIQEFAGMMGDDVAEPLRKMFRAAQSPEANTPRAQINRLKDEGLKALMVGDQETAKKTYRKIRDLSDKIGLGG